MSKRKTAAGVGRRSFLKGATLAGAATTVATPLTAVAQNRAPRPVKAPQGVSEIQKVAEMSALPPDAQKLVAATAGSDFMVDAYKSVGFEYIAATPGSSFRGLQESFINYGKNTNPEWLTALHEEISVAMGQGYSKVEGKPLLNLVHATVGLQHASMALYNAYCDRVPIACVTANIADATLRRPGVETDHTAQDGAVIVRGFTKWDDSPGSLEHYAESVVRSYEVALTPPMGPTLLVADSALQEDPIPEDAKLSIPRKARFAPAAGDPAAVADLAKMLVEAENPVLVADLGIPGPNGALKPLIELAEMLQCAVVDLGGRMNFPTRHGLNQSSQRFPTLASADLVVGLDVVDFWGLTHRYRDQLHRSSSPILKPATKKVVITAADQSIHANYQDFQRYDEADFEISGDSAATLPFLVEAVKKVLPNDRSAALEARGKRLTATRHAAFERAKQAAASGWDASPVSTARLTMELWNTIKDEDYSLVTTSQSGGYWSRQLWTMDKYYHDLGGPGAYGMGYGGGGAVGSALANRKYGRLSVAIQADGDLLISPGALWTAAHHKIPILFVMHNNRYYFQEVMHLQRMAERHQRDPSTAHIGTQIANPNVDFARMAESFGVQGFGPISDPAKLSDVLKQAVALVKRGNPVLVDVVAQGR